MFLIRFDGGYGTGFVLKTGGHDYFVTAAHVVKNLATGGALGIQIGWNKWKDFRVTRIPLPSKVDIAVLITDGQVSDDASGIEPGNNKGDGFPELFFLGFPYAGQLAIDGRTYRLSSTYKNAQSETYPMALVKHGILSGIDNTDPDSRIFLVDAINNPGFSGSPLLFFDQESKLAKVIGVVTARLPEQLIVPVGTTPPSAYENSGIVIAHDISSALKAIADSIQSSKKAN